MNNAQKTYTNASVRAHFDGRNVHTWKANTVVTQTGFVEIPVRDLKKLKVILGVEIAHMAKVTELKGTADSAKISITIAPLPEVKNAQ